MPLRSIIVIVLRISALEWIFSSLIAFIPFWTGTSLNWNASWFLIIPAFLSLLFWFFAEPFSRWVARNHDTTVSLGGLTRQDLYAFGFVYLGLSFFLESIGSVILDLISLFANTVSHSTPQTTLLTNSLPQIMRDIFRTLIGLIALFNANRFAKKLVSSEK